MYNSVLFELVYSIFIGGDMAKKEIIAVFVFCVLTFGIVIFTKDKSENVVIDTSYEVLVDTSDEVQDEVVLMPSEIIQNLQKEYNNKDIRAQLRIKGTTFTTPIPQSTNNEYYYRRLPNKSYSIIGSTYLDYRTKIDDSRVLIIYGHNSSKYDMPFKVLENYYSKEYYDEHKYIELVTTEGVKTYEVFSVFVETNDFSYYTNVEFDSNREFYNHVTNLREKSFYDTKVELKEDDNILILQACSTHKKYKNYKTKFVLVISREVNVDEND